MLDTKKIRLIEVERISVIFMCDFVNTFVPVQIATARKK